jgi:hypothetical protein
MLTGNVMQPDMSSIPEDLRPAHGLFNGLALSTVIWLSLLTAWSIL